MKRFIGFTIVALSVLAAGCGKNPGEKPKEVKSIIIDSDIAESFDDGIVFMMLAGTENIAIKGLTTTTTNVWAQEGLAIGIRLGELCGKKDIQYIGGAQYPLRKGRFDSINQEIDAAPGADASWRGAVSYEEVTDWKEYYISRYGRQPEIQPSSKDASEFIAEQIMAAPGEITLLAIGECTNIAKAILQHPEITENAKEIIYMGGAVYCPGNTTTYAEMNFLYDPEAAAICLRAPFKKQTIVSLDICNKVLMNLTQFMTIYNSVKSEEIRKLIRNNFPYPEFEADPSSSQYIWDVISAAIAIDPTIITDYDDQRLDVDDNPESPTYGKSFVTSDPSRQYVRIPIGIDEKRLWNLVETGMSKH